MRHLPPATCHLPDYNGRQQIPRLAGQHETFLRDTIMAASLDGLKANDLADLAHFLVHFK